jgi:hypothetical protein
MMMMTMTMTMTMIMMIMIVEQSVECKFPGKTKVLGKKPSRATWSTTNPTLPDPGLNPGCRCGKPDVTVLLHTFELSNHACSTS